MTRYLPTHKVGSLITSPFVWVVLVYAGLGFVLWLIPLFNLLHAESSAVVAGVAFFVAGLSSFALFRRGMSLRMVLWRQEAALLVPLVLLTFTLLWVPNCGYGQGLLFYSLFPPISVVLAVALAYAISSMGWRWGKTVFALIGLAIVVLTPLYDLGLHPQFFVYNHVFGGVLGPIYDEELVIRPGLVVFRGLTLLWALLAVLFGQQQRWRIGEGRATDHRPDHLTGTWVVVLLIGLGYVFAIPLGINTTGWHLQQTLGGHLQTEHFDLYYDPASLAEDELGWIAEDHEFRYAQLAHHLDVEVQDRIASYLYPDPETKARLTGARTTNVAPVWLRRPQVHVLLPVYTRVFAHELAHVFSREFGIPVLNASLSVGLVEGLAVAVEPPDGLPTPHEQVGAAAMQRVAAGTSIEPVLAENLASRLTPLGFWTGRGAVSYTTMGSFVRYLLDAYGAEAFKRVYAWGRFEDVYGKPVRELAQEWQQYVLGLSETDRATGDLAARRFSIPSIFEKPCPHYMPPYRRRFREGVRALAERDTVEALARMEEALRLQPVYDQALSVWAQLKLAEGAAAEVIARMDTLAEEWKTPALAVRLGDAWAMLGRPERALRAYDTALRLLPRYAHEQHALVVMRKSLADHPQILHLLTSGATPDVRARQLAAYREASPVAGVLEAVLWSRAGDFEQAVARLRTTPALDGTAASSWHRSVLRWQRLVWMAVWCHRAGDPGCAASFAEKAARAYHEAGAYNAAARVADFEAKLAWHQVDMTGVSVFRIPSSAFEAEATPLPSIDDQLDEE